MLTHENWQGARLQEIVAQCITPYQDRLSDRIQLEGDEIRLSPALSLSLALILHELATNAVKHGAFSNETGKIRIRWSVDRAVHPGRLRLTWTEYGGPRVEPPSRRGFGTKLIDRTFREDTGGKATLSFEVTGLVCSIDAPLS